MDLLGKLTDAGSMFWSSLDARERLIFLYAGVATLYLLVYLPARASAEEERERKLVARVKAEVLGA